MKTTLVFWDTFENSKRGTIRGLVILPIYIVLTLGWFYLTKYIYINFIDNISSFRMFLSLFITGSLIVSIVAVQDSNSVEESIKYGALSGFAVYGICNATILSISNKWNGEVFIANILWGILNTMLLSYILYKIVHKWPTTFKTI